MTLVCKLKRISIQKSKEERSSCEPRRTVDINMNRAFCSPARLSLRCDSLRFEYYFLLV